MNKIIELFNGISDEELIEAIAEIKESEKTGIVKEDGCIRKYAKLTGDITGGFTATDFFMTTVNMLKQAAYRWSDSKEK